MRKILSGAVMMLVMASSASVEAAPAYSWNLSRDMMNSNGIAPNPTTNPFGVGNVWTAMYDPAGTSHLAGGYLAMPTHSQTHVSYPWSVWVTSQAEPHVGVPTANFTFSNGGSTFNLLNGIPTLHPGPTLSSILRWKSPINGKVNIMGRIADADFSSNCGNGVDWFIDKGNFTLMLGTLANGNNGSTILQQNIPVSVGTNLYFIVSPKNNNYNCDTTYVDIIITSS